MNISVKVLVESFEGYIVNNGEYIRKCKRGDVISVREDTWRDMQVTFPEWFCLSHLQQEVMSPKSELVSTIQKEVNHPRLNIDRESSIRPRQVSKESLRILYLYQDDERYRYDYYLRELPLEIPYIELGSSVFLYGLNAHKMYPNHTPILYDENIPLSEIVRVLNIDVILIAQKSRMFVNYHPPKYYPTHENKTWLNGLDKITIPKIVIEEDYHHEADDTWYQENGIDLILQRHYSQVERQQKIKMDWLPFSVDENIFKLQDRDGIRINKIALVGSDTGDAYKLRRETGQILKKLNLIDIFTNREKVYEKYIECLRSYVGHLSCGSSFDICPAKSFEIMACGSALLTNKYSGIEKLFPEDSYYLYEENNVAEMARILLENKKLRKHIVDNALLCIKERHTNKIRARELVIYIKGVMR